MSISKLVTVSSLRKCSFKMIHRLIQCGSKLHTSPIPPLCFSSADVPVSKISKRSYSSKVSTFCLSEKLNQKDWLQPEDVVEIFQTIRDPDFIIHFLEKYSLRKDYKPTEQLYMVVIQALSHKKNFQKIEEFMMSIKRGNYCKLSDEFFFILIKIYGNAAEDIEKAVKNLFDMPKVYDCWSSIKMFNLVLNMLVNAKQFNKVHEVYYLGASELGLRFDICGLNILVKGLCKWGKLDKAFKLLDEFLKQGRKPNAKTYSTLMSSLCKHGRVDEALRVLKRMEKEGCYMDTIVFNTLILSLCKQERVTEGIELFDNMNRKGCEPDSGSYQAVLLVCSSLRNLLRASYLCRGCLWRECFQVFSHTSLQFKVSVIRTR